MKILILALAVALGRWVWVCQSDAEVVQPRDIYRRHHVTERDARGRPISWCSGEVQRAQCGTGSAVGLVCDVK